MTSLLNKWHGNGVLPNSKQELEAQEEFRKWQVDMYADNTKLSKIPKIRMGTELQKIRHRIYERHGNKIHTGRTISSTGALSLSSQEEEKKTNVAKVSYVDPRVLRLHGEFSKNVTDGHQCLEREKEEKEKDDSFKRYLVDLGNAGYFIRWPIAQAAAGRHINMDLHGGHPPQLTGYYLGMVHGV